MITPERVRTDLRCAGSVKRYHTWPTITTQTVADHTFHVMRIFYECFPGHVGAVTMHHILYHDMAEIKTGDLPYPIKRDNPTLKAELDVIDNEWYCEMNIVMPRLSVDEKRCVKMADMLEMMEFAVHEMCLGNKFAEPIWIRLLDWYASDEQSETRNDLTDMFVKELAVKIEEMET